MSTKRSGQAQATGTWQAACPGVWPGSISCVQPKLSQFWKAPVPTAAGRQAGREATPSHGPGQPPAALVQHDWSLAGVEVKPGLLCLHPAHRQLCASKLLPRASPAEPAHVPAPRGGHTHCCLHCCEPRGSCQRKPRPVQAMLSSGALARGQPGPITGHCLEAVLAANCHHCA